MKRINLGLNKMPPSLQKFRRNYSLSDRTKDMLLQFNISEKTANDWKFLSRMELEWVLFDIKQEYKNQISKLHPDKSGGDLEMATKLNSIYSELKKRFEKRLNPPPLQVPDSFQIDNDGNECKVIYQRKNKIIEKICKFCNNPITYTPSGVSNKSFCKSDCEKNYETQRSRNNRLKYGQRINFLRRQNYKLKNKI